MMAHGVGALAMRWLGTLAAVVLSGYVGGQAAVKCLP
jgi:hypothetical protein